MKKLGLVFMAVAFVVGSGFWKKNEDGKVSMDVSGLTKKATEVAAQAETAAAGSIEKAKKSMPSMTVKSEEIIADLKKPLDEIKQKVAGMDKLKLAAYASQYSTVFAETQNKITDLNAQVKDLKWKDKLGTKGKDLKGQLATYTDRFTGLKTQCTVYVDKLKSFGVDPAAFGVDLSAYGL